MLGEGKLGTRCWTAYETLVELFSIPPSSQVAKTG